MGERREDTADGLGEGVFVCVCLVNGEGGFGLSMSWWGKS